MNRIPIAFLVLCSTAFGQAAPWRLQATTIHPVPATAGIAGSTITSGTVANARLDADLQDLADGSLSGSLVGSGIDAGNVTAGTLANARLDSDLQTFAAITPAANIISILSAADYSAVRTLLGLVIGTNVQAYDADLTTYAGITPSANVQSVLGAADYSAIRTLLGLVVGTNVQAYDAELAALAGLTSAADALPYFTGSGAATVTTLTTAARTILDDTTVSAMIDTLGGASATGSGGIVRATSPTLVTPALGTPSALVLTNATGLPVAGGGTGSSTASGARTNLGLAIGSDVQAYAATLADLASQWTIGNASSPAVLQFHEDSDNGTGTIGLAAPVSIAANNAYALLLPAASDTLVGWNTTDTLANKTLSSPLIASVELNSGGTSTLTSPSAGLLAIETKDVLFESNAEATGTATTISADTTWTDITGMTVTLPAAGTYRITVDQSVNIQNNTAGAFTLMRLYNTTDAAAVANSERSALMVPSANAAVLQTVSLNKIITVAASKAIKLQGYRTATGTWATCQFYSGGNGYSQISYERIGD